MYVSDGKKKTKTKLNWTLSIWNLAHWTLMTSKVWTNEQQQQLQQLVLKQQPLKGSLEDTNFVFVISKKNQSNY